MSVRLASLIVVVLATSFTSTAYAISTFVGPMTVFSGAPSSSSPLPGTQKADDFLEALSLVGDLNFRLGENLPAPAVNFRNNEEGQLWKKLNWNYEINLEFQSGFQPGEVEDLADQFNLSGGNGAVSLISGIEFVPFTNHNNYRLRLNASPRISWMNADINTTAIDSSIITQQQTTEQVDEVVTAVDAAVGLWLGFGYIGGQYSYNYVLTDDSTLQSELHKKSVFRGQIIVKLSDSSYLRLLGLANGKGSDNRRLQIGIATEFDPF